MLTLIHNLPDHVLGIRASGEVDQEDVKSVLLPGLAVKAEQFGEIYYLLVLETGVENFSAGAWIQDLTAGLKHFTRWKKMAIVTDQPVVEKFTDLFSFITPGEARGFKMEDLKKARKWVIKR